MANQKMSEFVKSLAAQTGLDENAPEFQDLLKDEAFTNSEVPDTISKLVPILSSSLLNINAAKNHKDVASHFKLRFYRNVDKALRENLLDSGLDEDSIAEIEKEPDTLNRLKTAFGKVNEVYKSKTPSPDGKAKEIADKYNTLVNEFNTYKQSVASEKSKWQQDLESERVNWEVDSMIKSYQFSDSLPSDDAVLLLKNKLAQSPYVLKKVEGKIGVFQKDNPDLRAVSNNKVLEVKDLLDQFASPYVKKAQTPPTAGNQGRQITPPASNANTFGVNMFADKLAKDKAQFESRVLNK